MNSSNLQRQLCGGVGLLFFLLGAAIYLRNPQQVGIYAAAAMRAGLLLIVIWLAWPQLVSLASDAPRVLTVSAAILVLMLVIRPRLARFVVVLVVLAIVYSFISKWWRSVRGQP